MIYYIYKVRRKQTSIRSSRSVLTHRYLRYISWISWKGGHRPPQAGFFHTEPQSRLRHFRGGAYTQGRDRRAPTSTSTWRTKQTSFRSFPEKKKKTSFFPFPRTFACRSSCVALPASSSHILPAAHPRPVRYSLLRPSHKQKNAGPQHCAANPLTTKSVDFSLKKTHVGTPGLHALASAARTYSLTARIHYCPFFLSPFLQRKRKKKTEANSAGSNTSLGLTSFVLTMYAIGPAPRPLKQR